METEKPVAGVKLDSTPLLAAFADFWHAKWLNDMTANSEIVTKEAKQ